ncbi:MAG TPA: type II toxin-antitoxin system CcdA family antitoxin [Thermoanaerobaculia bacterium]|nr:type II toxin-antitoxin system CcdA family antitoxin [Thermoanaerobaculia bacterium]
MPSVAPYYHGVSPISPGCRFRVNSDLLKKAHELGINPATTLEEALVEEIRKRNREIWLEENRDAIETYNELDARQGVFSDGLRGF